MCNIELKEAITILIRDREAVKKVISLCELTLRLQESGMPKKKYPAYDFSKGEITIDIATGNGIYNQAIDEMAAWITSKFNMERVSDIVYKVMYENDEPKHELGAGLFCMEIAEAIVKNILGEEIK